MPSGVLEFPVISDVYARYAALTELSADIGGWLLLYAGLDRDGVAVAMASNVAGAASLGLEPDAARAKAALRAGVCDFVVNDLSEALRILKNEIRKRNGVSVVLESDVEAAVKEMIERGVQPEVLAFPVPKMVKRGARMLAKDPGEDLIPVGWSAEGLRRQSLSVLDGLALTALENKDARTRWVKASPRYLGRAVAGQRFVCMTGAEVDAFVAAVRKKVKSGEIAVPVRVERGGEMVLVAS
jgi:urocanate hydratase